MTNSGYGLVYRYEFGAVGESRLHLHFGDHLANAFENIIAGQDCAAQAHDFRNALAVASQLEQVAGDQRHGLGVVKLEAPCPSGLR